MTDKDRFEQQLMDMLYRLPIRVKVTEWNGQYLWECLETRGTAPTSIESASEALTFLIHHLTKSTGKPRERP